VANLSKPTASLWRDPAFRLYWLGRNISLFGTQITVVVLPILVFQRTGSALLTALLAVLEVVPYLAFGLLAGALADRLDRKRLMIGSDLANAALLGSIPLAAALGALSLPHIYAVALLSALAFVWFDVANFGALPALVGRLRLVEANSYMWSSTLVIETVGAALAGGLAATIGAAPALAVDAVSYLLSAVSLLLLRRSFNNARGAAPAAGGASGGPAPALRGIAADIRAGLQFLWQHRLVRALTLLGFGISVTSGAISGLIVVYAVRVLGLANNDARIGLLFTAGSVGAIAASALLPRLNRRVPPGWISLGAMGAMLLCSVVLALAPGFAAALLIYALWIGVTTLVQINGIVLRQRVIPEQLLSRTNAAARMITWGGAPIGAIIGGGLAEVLPLRETYLIMTSGVAVSVLLGWFSPLRDRQAVSDIIEAPPIAGSPDT
jgi:MFS family permease